MVTNSTLPQNSEPNGPNAPGNKDSALSVELQRLREVNADLLAACFLAEAALGDIGAELASHPDYTDYFGAHGHGLKVIQALQAAIAKATGQS